jgi:hypothetical protein
MSDKRPEPGPGPEPGPDETGFPTSSELRQTEPLPAPMDSSDRSSWAVLIVAFIVVLFIVGIVGALIDVLTG